MKKDSLSFYEYSSSNKPVSIISIPLELGSDARGLAETPAYLHGHGLHEMFTAIGAETSEQTIECPTPALRASTGTLKNVAEVVAVAKKSCAATNKAAARGDIILALGGDHAISFGTIAGAALAHKKIGVIWIDAHPDVNTDETTISGNLHSMPASAAMGFGHELLTSIGKKGAAVDPANFLHIGAKDFDQAEIDFLRRESITTITMLDIAEKGLAPAFAAVDALKEKVDAIWVSMDIDSIDKEYAPGVAMPSEGGFTKREIFSLAQYIGQTCTLAGMDIVEMLPANDKEGTTAKLAIELIARFLGSEYSSYTNYMEHYRETNIAANPSKTEK